ncbi:MAG: hypothetical protein N7Q72_06585, partial [Spiroplasma sp. Tabriz.8]|nr:hypothetical protein [Spiroplasma sp. Tabriz.8]
IIFTTISYIYINGRCVNESFCTCRYPLSLSLSLSLLTVSLDRPLVADLLYWLLQGFFLIYYLYNQLC